MLLNSYTNHFLPVGFTRLVRLPRKMQDYPGSNSSLPSPSRYLPVLKYCLVIFLMGISLSIGYGQNVYKTPSGKKYHLASCRMVENVSKKLLSQGHITTYKLTPCKICNPPVGSGLQFGASSGNKAVGTAESVRCKGMTQRGTRCQHKTRLANGYCYQHTSQHQSSRSTSRSSYGSSTVVSACGARTQSGGYCKRKVKGGGRCYQH
jgi:hypothetical protein